MLYAIAMGQIIIQLEVQFLFQWISVSIHEFNSVLFHETFPAEDGTDM